MHLATTSKYHHQIISLRLFTRLEASELNNILQHAHIVELSGKQILFRKNDVAKFFYIILQGEIKLTAKSDNGEELVIQKYSVGQSLGDVFAQKFIVDAVAISGCSVLAIDQKKMTQSLLEMPQFALDFLQHMSLQNLDLIERIEQLNLIDAKQKVGKFLLKNSFVDGKKRQKFSLKYDKNEIANYLKIRPETFSRLLKKLILENEIKLDGSAVELTRQDALCDFCDEKTYKKCQHHDEDFCKKRDEFVD